MKLSFRANFWLLFVFLLAVPAQASLPLSSILTQADYILNPRGSYEYDATLTVYRDGKAVEGLGLRAAVPDSLGRRIIVQEPEREADRSLLLENEKIWLYLPKIQKSVRIPPQTEFAGEVSSLDLAQPLFSMLYQPVGMEKAEWQGRPALILKLIPRTKAAAYSKVRLWLGQDGFHPIQAEFFGEKNNLVKTCLYEDHAEMLGMKRPRRWIYRDAAHPENETVLTIKKMLWRNFASPVFDPKAGPELFNWLPVRPTPASAPIRLPRRAGRKLL